MRRYNCYRMSGVCVLFILVAIALLIGCGDNGSDPVGYTPTTPEPPAVVPASVMAGTMLNSPVLTALAGQYGQTTRPLDSLTMAEIEEAVMNSYAVGFDLSTLTPERAAADPVLRAALRLGTPIVFENNGALTDFLSGIEGLSTGDVNNATAAMAAAIGIGVESQIAVVVPSSDPENSGDFDIVCLGAALQPLLSEGTLEGGEGITEADLAEALLNKPLLPSISDLPVTDTAAIVAMIDSVISGMSSSSVYRGTRATTTPTPSPITVKNFLIKHPAFVWYPNNYEQDFVIQCSIRVQMYLGNGGQKKWLRFIVDDSDNTLGFLNRGDLIFKERDDKGYFIAGAEVQITPSESWVNFSGRSPGYWDAGADDGDDYEDYEPELTTSRTSIDVDYMEGGIRKTENFTEERQFRADEFEGRTWPGADWRMRLMLCHWYNSMKVKEIYRLDRFDDEPVWYAMIFMTGWGVGTDSVAWPMQISRGTDQMGLHPKVQSYYWVPADKTEKSTFTMKLSQEAWNVWSEYNITGSESYRKVFSATVTNYFTVDFGRLSTKTAIWASNTYGNPGAKLVMQGDGNLVIYSKYGRALWASGTDGNPGAYKVMQGDGNLVIYSKDGKALWSSGTYGTPGAYDVMQEDGNYVIYSSNE